jgi:hypothetical protein
MVSPTVTQIISLKEAVPDKTRHSNLGMPPQRRNVTPTKERNPSEGTSPQRRNVTPAQERHPSAGWGWGPSTQKWIPAYAGMTIFFVVLYEAKIYQNITHPPACSKPQPSPTWGPRAKQFGHTVRYSTQWSTNPKPRVKFFLWIYYATRRSLYLTSAFKKRPS